MNAATVKRIRAYVAVASSREMADALAWSYSAGASLHHVYAVDGAFIVATTRDANKVAKRFNLALVAI